MILVHQFKLECRKHLAVFGSLTGLSALINLYFLFSTQQDLAFLVLTANMVIGLLVPLYIYTDLYKEFLLVLCLLITCFRSEPLHCSR